MRLKSTSTSGGISPGGEPLYRVASLSESNRRLPGITQRLSKVQNVCAVFEKIAGRCRTTRRWVNPGSRLLPACRSTNLRSPPARSRLGGRTGLTHGILVPKPTALRRVRGRSGASPYL
jgi:hypothetical protein